MTGGSWDEIHQHARAPWDIGRPQPAIVHLADARELIESILDSGCGSGEHALLAATMGLEVTGIDIAHTAIELARGKARLRGLSAQFFVGDMLALSEVDRLEPPFRTVIDTGCFHTFANADRPVYASNLAAVVEPGGVLHLLCFSEHTPGTDGPRRVTQVGGADNAVARPDLGWRANRWPQRHEEVRIPFHVRPFGDGLARVLDDRVVIDMVDRLEPAPVAEGQIVRRDLGLVARCRKKVARPLLHNVDRRDVRLPPGKGRRRERHDVDAVALGIPHVREPADLRTPDAGTVSDRPGEDSAWTVDIGATCSRLVAAVKFGS